jgi:hypothetical protein
LNSALKKKMPKKSTVGYATEVGDRLSLSQCTRCRWRRALKDILQRGLILVVIVLRRTALSFPLFSLQVHQDQGWWRRWWRRGGRELVGARAPEWALQALWLVDIKLLFVNSRHKGTHHFGRVYKMHEDIRGEKHGCTRFCGALFCCMSLPATLVRLFILLSFSLEYALA